VQHENKTSVGEVQALQAFARNPADPCRVRTMKPGEARASTAEWTAKRLESRYRKPKLL